MKKANPFHDKVMTKLTPHGPITSRAMFGGYGIYYDTVMFAMIAEDELYFKVDEMNKKQFIDHHSHPFVYDGGPHGPLEMPYWTLPPHVLENPALLKEWVLLSYQIAMHIKMKKKPKKPRVGKLGN